MTNSSTPLRNFLPRSFQRSIFKGLIAASLVFSLLNSENDAYFSPLERVFASEPSTLKPYPGDRVNFDSTEKLSFDESLSYPLGRDNDGEISFFATDAVLWKIDDRTGTVAAFDPTTRTPLWSNDGVVFRSFEVLSHSFDDEEESLSDAVATRRKERATEIYGRVYLLLNDGKLSRLTVAGARGPRRPNVLVALDPDAQGRLVWILNANDFERFFSDASARSPIEFIDPPQVDADDRLTIRVQKGREERAFSIDAASGILTTLP